jgi:transcriptional regulator with XRE-family HTH domain
VRNAPAVTLSVRGDDMAPGRQRLSQRRKAARLAQESLAPGLGGECSTAARWEAADTQPLPSIRLDVAVSRSLRVPVVAQPVSAESDHSVVADAGPEDAVALGPAAPALLADIDHPADINIADADMRPCKPAPVLVGVGGFAGSCVPLPAQTDVSDLSSVATMPLKLPLTDVQRRPYRSQRFTRFAVAGVLALVWSAASVSLLTSNNGPILPGAVENPARAAPVAAIPAPDPRNSNEFSAAPARSKSTDASAASVSTPHTARSANRSKPATSKMASPRPRTPAIPAEAYAWAQMAELSGSDQSRSRLRSELPPGP